MIEIFYKMAEISLQASMIVLAVLALRLIFRKAPKRLRCALWGLVALRLLLPFSVQSPVSLQPDTAPMRENMEYLLSSIEESLPDTPAGEEEYTTHAVPEITQTEPTRSAPSFFARVEIPRLLASVWIVGMAGLLGYAALSFLLLRRRVAASLPLGGNAFETDAITSPFLLGVLRPHVYLPCGLTDGQRIHVLAHERAHIRRGDHILKPLAFLLASVYWFDPLLWLAYFLFNRDLELACDERVIRDYSNAERAAYAETLLLCGQGKHGAALSPLAFGEVSVKTRVKQALSYKKPALWIILAAVLAAAVAAVCLLTEPKTGAPTGVEVLAENEKNELYYYKILSDGTLRQKPDAPGGGYGGLSADADCFECYDENGKTTVGVIKTELHHPDGEPAPLTEDRETVFYAVAAAAKHEIRKMEIFEMPGNDGQTFVAVEYKTSGGFSSEVFRYAPASKSLEELCTADSIHILDVYSSEPETAYPIGVEVIAMDTNQTNGLKTYRVLSDGSAEEIESEAWGAYGGLFAEADCFSAQTVNGKPKVTVVNKVLFDTAREEVPITEERAAIFDAAAEIAAGEIVSMQIFEQQTGEQLRFVALEYAGSVTDVFRFNAAEKALVKLCAIEGPRVREVHTVETHTAAAETELDKAIHNAFLSEQETSGWRGEFGAEGHILLGTKETKTQTVAYVLHEYASFGFENDCFIELGGHAMAAKLTFRNAEDGYEIERIEYPEDGDHYSGSIKRLFPKKYQSRIFSHSETDSEALWQQCATQAEEYLQSIGRSAEIMRDVERTWLYEVIDPAMADKMIYENPELTNYPNWIGTREQIENGERYVYTATLNGTDKKEILFYKTPYDYRETVLESFLVSAETGEIITRNAVRF